MPAATENTTRHMVSMGNVMAEVVDVTWNDGDTFASEFGSIFGWFFEPTTAAAHGITASGPTLTFHSGGSLTGKLTVLSDSQ